MKYRRLGKTDLMVSEIGFGAEWVTYRTTPEEVRALVGCAEAAGINILDCWMSDPDVRSLLGDALQGSRERWFIQGHIGSTWDSTPIDPATYQGPSSDKEDEEKAARGQYVRTRDLEKVVPAFEDLLERLHTDYIDLGMIHYVDDPEEFAALMAGGPFIDYVRDLHKRGVVRHIGLSTHNPDVAIAACSWPEIEMTMFSVNPAFDLLPATVEIERLFGDFSGEGEGMDPVRAELYATCERADVGLTVMKPYAGGRLLDAEKSPFGVALTPVQCIHYCLTRPSVASVLAGYADVAQMEAALAYETAAEEQLDYASVLAGAPKHAYYGQCTYCGHCAPCSAGIDIAMVSKLYDLAAGQQSVPESVLGHYQALRANADDCVGCGVCEGNCPFGVAIVERMEAAKKLFG